MCVNCDSWIYRIRLNRLMGNKVCCEDSRTHNTNLGSVEPEIVSRDRVEVREVPPPHPELARRKIRTTLKRTLSQLQSQRSPRQITYSPLHSEFFNHEIEQQSNPPRKRYGEEFYTG